jgi:putative colanic acid biosynthesis glycosyltransferase
MTTSRRRISIITVAYNDAQGLALTMSSIASQTFRDFEWIVVDGGSTDGTVRLLEQCAQPGLRWISEKDSGIYDAMNKGIRMSGGDYLVFLNAGDAFPGTATLSAVDTALSRAPAPDVLFGGAEYVFPDGKAVFRPPKEASKSIWHGLPANHQATYYSRAILEGILYDPKYRICGDYYLIAKLFQKGFDATYLNQSLVRFEVGGASYVNRKRLFWEPYLIQREVLHQSLMLRLLSLIKRSISTLGMVVLKNLHGGKNGTRNGA